MTPPPSDRHMAGHLLGGRYTLLTPIAQGGMGEVWKARDSETGRMVAAKVLRPELSGQELSLSRLRIEARNAMRVQHPNIASVLDSGEEDGRGWIVMELVDGRPLTDFLRGGTRIAVEDLLPVVMQVALALDAAAAAGVVHRDIKPANILIRPDGVVKLTDFGISRTVDQPELTAAGMVMGTAQYLPPEQAMGDTATSSGDLYALGVIAYEAAVGSRPFTGATQVDIAFAHVNDPVPALPEDIPLPFARVVTHLLEKEPRHRPATGAALVRELAAAAQTLDMSVHPHPLPSPDQDTPAVPGTARTPQPPVVHLQRRTLPPEMLLPPDTDEGGSRSPAPHRPSHRGAPADATEESPREGSSASSPTAAGPTPQAPARRWHALGSASGVASPTRASEPAGTPPSRAGARTPTARDTTSPTTSPAAPTRARRSPQDDPPPRRARHAGDPAQEADAPTRQGASTGARPARRRGVTRTSLLGRGTTASAGPDQRPSWRPVQMGHVSVGSTPRRRAPTTRYNRSVVAPPVPLMERLGQWAVIGLIVLTIILIAVATIQNRFGSLTSIMGMGAHVIEEARTCPIPWTTV